LQNQLNELRAGGHVKQKKMDTSISDKLWETCKLEHKKAVEVWEDECEQLRKAGIDKKDLPKKPVRPLRKDVIKRKNAEN
jgi:hypothetical protein